MIIRCLHLFPLRCRKIILRGLFFLGTSPSLYRVSHLWVCSIICTNLVRMRRTISCRSLSSLFFNSFWMASLIGFLNCPYLFTMCLTIHRLRSMYSAWVCQGIRLFCLPDFVRVGYTIFCVFYTYFFTMSCFVSSAMCLRLFRIFIRHYFTPSRRAFSRIASSRTVLFVTPSFAAISVIRRLASGVRRILVSSLVSMHTNVPRSMLCRKAFCEAPL